MKTKLLYAIFALLLSHITMAQGENTLAMNLRGTVKSLRQYSYIATEKDGILEKGELASNGHQSSVFDRLGLMTENVFYQKDGDITIKMLHKYDANGQQTEEYCLNKKGEIIQKTIFKYNGYQLTETNVYELDVLSRKTIYEYNEHKQNSSYITYRVQLNDIYAKAEMGYNVLDRMLWENVDNVSYGTKITVEYEYDESGREIESIVKEELSGMSIIKETLYDDYGNVVEIKETTQDETVSTLSYKYEYDEKNNWIKAYYSVDNKPAKIIERQIVYY